MNIGSLRTATVKASRLLLRLHHHFHSKPLSVAPDPLTWFEVIGYTVLLESDVNSVVHCVERSSLTEVVLRHRLRDALTRINPKVPLSAIEAVISQVICTENRNFFEKNRLFHKLLTEGVDVTYYKGDRTVRNKVWLVDMSNPLSNDWLVMHPLTVTDANHIYCLDVVVFINGLPLAIVTGSHSRQKNATLKDAYLQLQTYKQQIPYFFSYNVFQVICCGDRAKVGTLTSDWKEFFPWRTIDGEDLPQNGETELEVLIQGIFDKRRFLSLIKYFMIFDNNGNSKHLLRYPFCTMPYLK
ncbi:type I restriction endonuclease [Scytonema sp. NUACC26]|uniref:type I restriction endonuclease n=1 Tax=Scytonema sp. NUACC26 TaxID=3140176 RepID=UPI0034DC58E9